MLKILLGVGRFAFDLALVWMLFGRSSNRGTARVLGDGRILFEPDLIGLWAYQTSSFYLLALAGLELIRDHAGPRDFLQPGSSLMIVLLLAYSFPGWVAVTGGGLEELYWFRRNKRIRWEDIAAVEVDNWNRFFHLVGIIGANGVKITHSSLLADESRFLAEIERHCGDDLPPEFPRAPVAGVRPC